MIYGEYDLMQNDNVESLVGQHGGIYNGEVSQSAGGGSFVCKYNSGNITSKSSWTPLSIAGCGDARSSSKTTSRESRINGCDAVVGTFGTSSLGEEPGTQGSLTEIGGSSGNCGGLAFNSVDEGSGDAGFVGN